MPVKHLHLGEARGRKPFHKPKPLHFSMHRLHIHADGSIRTYTVWLTFNLYCDGDRLGEVLSSMRVGASALVHSIMSWVLGIYYLQGRPQTPRGDIRNKIIIIISYEEEDKVCLYINLLKGCWLVPECPGDGGNWYSS